MVAWVLGIVLMAGGADLDFQESVNTQADSTVTVKTDSAARTLYVDRVLIIGNKITKNRIITRELSLQPGDTINSVLLPGTLQWDKNKLYNLRLFNTVSVKALELPNNHIDILVDLTERWYIFPAPIFELSDRNFNEWWNNYNHDLSRINYGVRIYKNNFRGRNETVRMTAQFGFYTKFDLQYRIPNLDRKQKQGLTFSFDLATPRNVAYMTKDHKLVFEDSTIILRKSFGAGINYTYRKTFFETHTFGLNYRQSEVDQSILQLNPIYYNYNKTTQKYFSMSYMFNSEHRDVILYPLKGYQFTAFIAKAGLFDSDDVNQWELNVTYSHHWPLQSNFFLSNFTSFFFSTKTNQSYNVFNALGYQNQLLRGYENYVIEGPQFFLNKTTLKKKLFGHAWKINQMPIEQFNYFPLAIYVKVFADFGYVQNYPYYDENNFNQTLSNKLLSGAGTGLDIVTVYDLVLRVEYTFTPQKTSGAFFFNLRKEF